MPCHQQLCTEKRAVGRAKNKNLACHIPVLLNDSLARRIPAFEFDLLPLVCNRKAGSISSSRDLAESIGLDFPPRSETAVHGSGCTCPLLRAKRVSFDGS